MSSTEKALTVVHQDSEVAEIRKRLDDPKILAQIRDIYFQGADDVEFALCIQTCRHLALDPFSRQIYFIPIFDKGLGRYKLIPFISIDGLRTIAERTGQYKGQTPPQWCGPDGQWVDVWLQDYPPSACRVGVYREGFPEPVMGVARYRSFVRTTRDGRPMGQWLSMSDNMLWKCSEAQALRRAFPRDMSGDFGVQDAEPNTEAQGIRTPEDVEGIIDAIRNAASLDELDIATAELKGAPLDEAAKTEARTAWTEANKRLRSEPKPEPEAEAAPAPDPEPEPAPAAEADPHDYGPPAMTDAEVAAVTSGQQGGFGFDDGGDK